MTPPLTRNIGATERTLQALLQKHLSVEGITFPQWTAMVLLTAGGGRLTASDLAQRMAGGRVLCEAEAGQLLNVMAERGQLSLTADGQLELSSAANVVYTRLRAKVDDVTRTLFDSLPPGDVEATRRTLDLVAARAAGLLAA